MFIIMLYALPFVQVIILKHTCYWNIGDATLDPISCPPGITLKLSVFGIKLFILCSEKIH